MFSNTDDSSVDLHLVDVSDLTSSMIEDMHSTCSSGCRENAKLIKEGMASFTEKAFTANGKEYM